MYVVCIVCVSLTIDTILCWDVAYSLIVPWAARLVCSIPDRKYWIVMVFFFTNLLNNLSHNNESCMEEREDVAKAGRYFIISTYRNQLPCKVNYHEVRR